MFVAEELKKLTEKLFANASEKEKVFYNYLVKTSTNYPTDTALSEIEQVCFAAFCSNTPDRRSLAEKLSRSKPIKGLHYTNNLIELAAVARFGFDSETDKLNSYCRSNSTRDFFILKKLFPKISTFRPDPRNAIDRLAVYLMDDNLPEEWKPIYLEALGNTSDLLDAFVVWEAYLYIMDRHPATKQNNSLVTITASVQQSINYVDRLVKNIFTIFLLLVLNFSSFGLIYFILGYWDKAEPTLAAIGVIITNFFFLYQFFKGKELDHFMVINKAKISISNNLLKKLGINRAEVDLIIAKHEIEDRLKQEITRKNQQEALSIVPRQ